MTESRELLIPYGEATILALTCPTCAAKTVVDLADERQHRVWEPGARVLCGVCQGPFPENLKGALTRYHEALVLARNAAVEIAFRVASSAEAPEARNKP